MSDTFFQRYIRSQTEGKALVNHRFFDGSAPVSTYLPGQAPNRERGLISQREAKHHLEAYGGSEAIDWVMDAVNLYADTASTAKWHLEKDGEILVNERRKGADEDLGVADSRLVELLKQPNPMMDYGELVELLVVDLLLVGNAYWFKQGDPQRPISIFRMAPPYVKIKPGPNGIDKYVYQPPGATNPVEFSPEQVIHVKRPNPHDPFYGLGVIKGGGRPFDLELALTDATAHYFENKADPSLIIEAERRVPRDIWNKVRAQLRARAAGTHNAGEMLLLENGLKASTLSPGARDAMYRELGTYSRDRLLAMWRVHPKLLGIPGEGSDGGDKVSDIRREFDNKTMRPFLDKLENKISESLASLWGYTFHIDYRYIMPQEEAVKLLGDYGAVPGIKVREVRRFAVDAGILRDESTGDEEIDELVLNLPGEPADEDGEFAELDANGNPIPESQQTGGVVDNTQGSSKAGRPAKPENTTAIPKGAKNLPAGARARKVSGKALGYEQSLAVFDALYEGRKALPSGNDDGVRVTVGNKLPDEERPQDLSADSRNRDTSQLAASMQSELADAAQQLERELMDSAEGKAFDPKTVAKKVRDSRAWKNFRARLEVILNKYALQGISQGAVNTSSDYGIMPEDPLDYEALAKEVVYRPKGSLSTVETLRKSISTKARLEAEGGATQAEVNRMIQDSINAWTGGTAETVAITEAMHSYNEGMLATAEGSGTGKVLVIEDDDTDAPCVEASGQVWDVAYARENRIEHPRCKRSFVPIT